MQRGVACVIGVVVTKPTALPFCLKCSSNVCSSEPFPGICMLRTLLLTFCPVAIAVPEAAESVMAESAECVVIVVLYGKLSKQNVPSLPFAYIAAARTCLKPIPSPMQRIILLGEVAQPDTTANNINSDNVMRLLALTISETPISTEGKNLILRTRVIITAYMCYTCKPVPSAAEGKVFLFITKGQKPGDREQMCYGTGFFCCIKPGKWI